MHLSCKFFEKVNLLPKTSQNGPGQLSISCWLHFCWKLIWYFHEYFLKWMSNSGFLTTITYTLTPSTSNLVDAMAMASKQLFTMRSLHVWGRCYFESFRARAFVTQPPIWREIDILVFSTNQKCCLICYSRSLALRLTNVTWDTLMRQHFWLVEKQECRILDEYEVLLQTDI